MHTERPWGPTAPLSKQPKWPDGFKGVVSSPSHAVPLAVLSLFPGTCSKPISGVAGVGGWPRCFPVVSLLFPHPLLFPCCSPASRLPVVSMWLPVVSWRRRVQRGPPVVSPWLPVVSVCAWVILPSQRSWLPSYFPKALLNCQSPDFLTGNLILPSQRSWLPSYFPKALLNFQYTDFLRGDLILPSQRSWRPFIFSKSPSFFTINGFSDQKPHFT